MRSTLPCRIASAIETARLASRLLTILPSASATSSSSAPASGESLASPWPSCSSSLRTSSRRRRDRVRDRGRDPRPALDRALRQRRIAELDADVVDRQAEHVGRHLRHDRVGAGADVGGRASRPRRGRWRSARCGPRPASAALPRRRSPCPSRPVRCRRASSAARDCACPSRTPRRPGGSIRAAACWCREGPRSGRGPNSIAGAARIGSSLSATASSSIAHSSA